AESGELAHRPESPAVHGGLHPARVRKLPGQTKVAHRIEIRDVLPRVQGIDRIVGDRRKPALPLRVPLRLRPIDLPVPALLRLFRLLDRHAARSERAITRRWISLVPS